MRTMKFLLQKEFRQIFRNPTIMKMILAVPVLQLIILPLAANYEVKDIRLAVIDSDHSQSSSQLVNKIISSGYFHLASSQHSFNDAFKAIEDDNADLILQIPPSFEKNLAREGSEKVFIAANAINGVKANLGAAYLNQIIKDYNNSIVAEAAYSAAQSPVRIELLSINWFNRYLNYRLYMVPGILAFLVTMIGAYLTALNIVKEKELGTIEQLNVSPLSKFHFILGKLIPFWIIGLLVFTLGLLVARLIYGIVPQGNLLLLYLFIAIYLLAVLGLGLLISTFAETQQQAMFIAFFFMMIFILMGGLFTPIDSMPGWAQFIARLNPVSYLIDVMRMLVLKGSGFRDVLSRLLIVSTFALVLNSLAIWNYRKSS